MPLRAPRTPGFGRMLLCVALVGALAPAACARAPRATSLELAPAPARPVWSASTTLPAALTRPAPLAAAVSGFDADAAMADAVAITRFGVRPGGSRAERAAADYISDRLESLGYEVRVVAFALPNGLTSRNVMASARGTESARHVIVGAHFDTKPPSPGANDNASGCAVALELARILGRRPASATVDFVFYGTEEFLVDTPGDNHHLGSRFHAQALSTAEISDTAAMLSLDMVGYGARPYVRTMEQGPRDFADLLLVQARRRSVPLTFRKDPGATGWSDHEPYEERGVPVAWIQWLQDPAYHTKRDDEQHLQRRPLEVTGRLVLETLHSLDATTLERLCDR